MTAEERKAVYKYIGVITGAILFVGLSGFAIIPYANEHVRPTHATLYALITYYPLYFSIFIAVCGYFWIKSDSKKRANKQSDATPAA